MARSSPARAPAASALCRTLPRAFPNLGARWPAPYRGPSYRRGIDQGGTTCASSTPRDRPAPRRSRPSSARRGTPDGRRSARPRRSATPPRRRSPRTEQLDRIEARSHARAPAQRRPRCPAVAGSRAPHPRRPAPRVVYTARRRSSSSTHTRSRRRRRARRRRTAMTSHVGRLYASRSRSSSSSSPGRRSRRGRGRAPRARPAARRARGPRDCGCKQRGEARRPGRRGALGDATAPT